MKRFLFLSLALGVATTILVAWGLALLPRRSVALTMHGPVSPPTDAAAKHWKWVSIEVDRARGVARLHLKTDVSDRFTGLQTRRAAPSEWTLHPDDEPGLSRAIGRNLAVFRQSPDYAWVRDFTRWPRWLPHLPREREGLLAWGASAAGWPMLCMSSITRASPSGRVREYAWSLPLIPASVYGGPGTDSTLGRLPLRPEPLGFCANSALFAAAWLLPLSAMGPARRTLRRRRGRCPRCAYDLRGLPANSPCPECGRVAPPRTSGAATPLTA